MSYELRNRPSSPWSLCSSVVEMNLKVWGSIPHSWGLRFFLLFHARDKTKDVFLCYCRCYSQHSSRLKSFRVLIGYPVTFSFVHPSRCNQVLFLVFQYSNKSSLFERRTKLPCNQEWMNSIRPDQAYQRDNSGILEQTEWRSQTLSDHPGRLRVATERKTTSYCVFLQCLSSNINALDLT